MAINKRHQGKTSAIGLILLALAYAAQLSAAPSLTPNADSIWPVRLSVNLSNDPVTDYPPLAGLQLDIAYDANILTPGNITLGNASAGLDLNWAVSSPGTLRIILKAPGTGNLTTMSEGEVLTIPFTRVGCSQSTALSIESNSTYFGDAAGQKVTDGNMGQVDINWGPDLDGDCIPNTWDSDIDGDGMPNSFETQYGLNPNDASDANGDLDGDGLSNLAESQNNTDPTVTDTDGDGISDYDEVINGTNPRDDLIPVIMQIINSLLLSD